jgi:hypothetical protein
MERQMLSREPPAPPLFGQASDRSRGLLDNAVIYLAISNHQQNHIRNHYFESKILAFFE